MSDRALPLSQQLCFALYSANHAMMRVYRPLLLELKLTYPQYLVLLALWENDTRTVGDLGKTLSLESNTLTPLLKRMEAAGLLERARSKEDERMVTVKLTPKGAALESESLHLVECVSSAATGEDIELTELRDQIAALAHRLNAAS